MEPMDRWHTKNLIIHPYIINGVQGGVGNMQVLRDGHLNAGGGGGGGGVRKYNKP